MTGVFLEFDKEGYSRFVSELKKQNEIFNAFNFIDEIPKESRA